MRCRRSFRRRTPHCNLYCCCCLQGREVQADSQHESRACRDKPQPSGVPLTARTHSLAALSKQASSIAMGMQTHAGPRHHMHTGRALCQMRKRAAACIEPHHACGCAAVMMGRLAAGDGGYQWALGPARGSIGAVPCPFLCPLCTFMHRGRHIRHVIGMLLQAVHAAALRCAAASSARLQALTRLTTEFRCSPASSRGHTLLTHCAHTSLALPSPPTPTCAHPPRPARALSPAARQQTLPHRPDVVRTRCSSSGRSRWDHPQVEPTLARCFPAQPTSPRTAASSRNTRCAQQAARRWPQPAAAAAAT